MPGWSDALKPHMMWRLMKDAASDWSRDRAPRLGAALAYYTVFSLVPFLVVVIAVIGLVFGEVAAQSAILSQIAELVGEQTAAAIKDMIQRADQPSTGLLPPPSRSLRCSLALPGFSDSSRTHSIRFGASSQKRAGVCGALLKTVSFRLSPYWEPAFYSWCH